MASDVIFGMPSANCSGTGICKIVTTRQSSESPVPRSCRHTRAQFSVWNNGAGLTMRIRREHLCVELYRKHLRHGFLEMLENSELPASMMRQLGLKSAHIPAGLYLVENHGAYFSIHFKL